MEIRKARKKVGTTLLLSTVAMMLLSGCSPQYIVLHPVGPVGKTELNLIIWSVILTGIVIIPVIFLAFFIAYRYRDKPGNKATYMPEWSESKTLEIIWWSIPIVIVGILGTYTTITTFSLEKPPTEAPNAQPITIQVTSLDWKWLFQYPGQKVATVNYCEVPTNTPVNFVITSDSPMNSFWVPQLGGQEYTMPGMAMRLWLQADKPGSYYGHGANFTGTGFAHDDFKVIAAEPNDFNNWVSSVKQNAPALTVQGYKNLTHPSVVKTMSFSSIPPHLFSDTVMADGGKYMHHMATNLDSTGVSSNDMNSMAGMGQ